MQPNLEVMQIVLQRMSVLIMVLTMILHLTAVSRLHSRVALKLKGQLFSQKGSRG